MVMDCFKRLIVLSGVFLLCIVSNAQVKWYNPQAPEYSRQSLIFGKGWDEKEVNYCRLPLRAKEKVRRDVWRLSCESAGLSLRFRTDAESIQVRYKVTGGFSMPHMPSTGVSGVDLYREDGAFCFGTYAFGDTVRYTYTVDRGSNVGKIQEYELYLPLYNGVRFLEIGVESRQHFAFVAKEQHDPIVVYGTSIAQGACASRPGMAWTNILHRQLKRPVVNLGFSGNGKLEPEVISFINEIKASVYILDCMANLNMLTTAQVAERVEKAVYQIRSCHDTPILLVDHAGYSNGNTNQNRYDTYTAPNRGQQEAYRRLKMKGVKNLYYISHEDLNYSPDAWVDYVHPSDYGMVRHAEVISKQLLKIGK